MRNVLIWATVMMLFALNIYQVNNIDTLKTDIGAMQDNIDRLIQGISLADGNSSIAYRDLQADELSIPIVAVSSTGEGVMSNLTLRTVPGTGNILVNTYPFVETDVQFSVNSAVALAKTMTEFGKDKDFIFRYEADSDLIGGESAGAATAALTLAALQNLTLSKAVITGTINPDGTIGMVSGIAEKAEAVARAGFKYFLIPEGQANYIYYDKVIASKPYFPGFEVQSVNYVPKRIDLIKTARESWNLTIVEVEDIDEAMRYLIEE